MYIFWSQSSTERFSWWGPAEHAAKVVRASRAQTRRAFFMTAGILVVLGCGVAARPFSDDAPCTWFCAKGRGPAVADQNGLQFRARPGPPAADHQGRAGEHPQPAGDDPRDRDDHTPRGDPP